MSKGMDKKKDTKKKPLKSAAEKKADLWHLPGGPDACPCDRRQNLQAGLRPPRAKPPLHGPGIEQVFAHVAKPRLCDR